jgi:hypothetical protein
MANDKQNSSIFKIIIVVILGCISAPFVLNFALQFAADTVFPVIFPDSIDAVNKITRQFVIALQTSDVEEAYGFLDDTSEGSQAMRDMKALVNEEAIANYENLYICDWSDKGEISDYFGEIYFKDTSMRFNVQLIRDANKSWKIHRFILLPELERGPFGNCQ